MYRYLGPGTYVVLRVGRYCTSGVWLFPSALSASVCRKRFAPGNDHAHILELLTGRSTPTTLPLYPLSDPPLPPLPAWLSAYPLSTQLRLLHTAARPPCSVRTIVRECASVCVRAGRPLNLHPPPWTCTPGRTQPWKHSRYGSAVLVPIEGLILVLP